MENTNLNNKVCLITGANSGIGKATARKLADMGAYVIMLCRNEERADAARQDIIEQTGNAGVELLIADLALQHDIRQAAENFTNRFDQLDILINNAGMIGSERTLTAERIELTFAVNHLAPFLLTNLLMESLIAAESARVVTVSSEAHRTATSAFDLKNLQLEVGFSPMKAYGVTKLCNIMFTRELAKRTRGTGITANALHPGMVRTNLTSEAGWLMYLLFTIGKPFMKSPDSGAETPVYLATSEEVEEVTGKYFKNKKQVTPAPITRRDEITEQLWKISSEFTGLD
ncbi:MAG: SDR family oxidoreductase [Balneolaceae bacterium]|nr:SDR family oxidoreductase [Balneolaceae bacterium]